MLQVLDESARPLSHQELASHPQVGPLDRVTLYRTLATLQAAGLLHRIQGVDGVWRFSAHGTGTGTCGGNHLHFLCLECHAMSCLPEQALPWVRAPEGAQVFGKQLVVYGLCAACASRTKPGPAGNLGPAVAPGGSA